MIHWTEVSFVELCETAHERRDHPYCKYIAAFDIETSRYKVEENKEIAFMYIWQMAIEDVVVYGRTWDEFRNFLAVLAEELNLTEKHKLLVYVHNQKFDFSFFKSEVNISEENFLSKSKSDVIKCVVESYFEFRDSLCYTERSLEQIGELIGIPKLSSYDYDRVRLPETPLTDEELQYCENDVKILVKFFRNEVESKYHGYICSLPYTATQKVKQIIRKNYRNDAYKPYAWSHKMTQSKEDKLRLDMLRKSYWGAFSFINPLYNGRVLNDVHSIDIDSAYPAAMLFQKFPDTKFQSCKLPENARELLKSSDKIAYIIVCKIKGLKNKYPNMGYLPFYKRRDWELLPSSIRSECGKIMTSANEMLIVITEVDLEVLYELYEFEELRIFNVYSSKKRYLPKYIINTIMELYGNKKAAKIQLNQIKKKRKPTPEEEYNYNLIKTYLNRVYGIFVQDPIPVRYAYNEKENEVLKTDTVELSGFSEVVMYQWGVWVTAYARRNIIHLMKKIAVTEDGKYQDNILYVDTDCIKYKPKHAADSTRINNIINDFNADVKHQVEKIFWGDHDIYHQLEGIGTLDKEMYDRYKQLGLKRYCYETPDTRLVIKLAGLSSKNQYFDGKTNDECFESFNPELNIPAEISGGLECLHVNFEKHCSFRVTDYMGESTEISVKSFALLRPVPFKFETDVWDNLDAISEESM